MGRAMAERLASAGFSLQVWNRTRARAEGLANAVVCDSPAQAAAGVDIVVSSLADDAAVREVVLGDGGVLAGLRPDAVHVGTSTISPGLGRLLDEQHRARGAHFVATPVLGRPDAAAAGQLWILSGGADDAVARVAAVVDRLGRGRVHLGGPEQALLGKLIANMMIASTIELLGEATALGEKGGIPPAQLIHMLTSTLFGAPVVVAYGERIAAQKYEPANFRIALGLKDVELALASGHELRVPLPVADVVRDHMIEALARGLERYDWTGLAAIPRAAAGL
ncbi:MAG: yfjR [bacterium]|nr:yfjR [bacterium]